MSPEEKLARIFAVAPWLMESKNVVHLPISGVKIEDGLTWRELYQLVESLKGEIGSLEGQIATMQGDLNDATSFR